MKTFNEWLQEREVLDENYDLESYVLEMNGGGMFTKVGYNWKDAVKTLTAISLGQNPFDPKTVKDNVQILRQQIAIWKKVDPEKAEEMLANMNPVIEKLKDMKTSAKQSFKTALTGQSDNPLGNSERKFGKYVPHDMWGDGK